MWPVAQVTSTQRSTFSLFRKMNSDALGTGQCYGPKLWYSVPETLLECSHGCRKDHPDAPHFASRLGSAAHDRLCSCTLFALACRGDHRSHHRHRDSPAYQFCARHGCCPHRAAEEQYERGLGWLKVWHLVWESNSMPLQITWSLRTMWTAPRRESSCQTVCSMSLPESAWSEYFH